MRKHSFIYTIIEDYVEVDTETKKLIKNIKLTKDIIRPEMNLTSFYQNNKDLHKLLIKKLGIIFFANDNLLIFFLKLIDLTNIK